MITPEQINRQLKVGDTIMLGNDVTDPLIVKVQGMHQKSKDSQVCRGDSKLSK